MADDPKLEGAQPSDEAAPDRASSVTSPDEAGTTTTGGELNNAAEDAITDAKESDEDDAETSDADAATAAPDGSTVRPMSIARYSQLYAVSRNPFGLALILPLIVFSFIGLEAVLLIVIAWGDFNYASAKTILTGFLIITTGLMLIPAVVLRGYITFDDKGIEMRYAKQRLAATWDKVAGLTYERDSGVCVLLKGQEQSQPKITVAGGLRAREGGEAVIPIRFFGDRRFAILYEVRDRVPESAWKHALQQAQPGGSRRPLIIYALTVAFGAACMVAVAIAVYGQ